MSPAPHRALLFTLLGWLVTALALGFVAWQLMRIEAWQLADEHLLRLAPAVLLGAVAYALAGFLLAEAWRQLLAPDAGSAPASAYHAVYGRTQIVKYLPGNLFHLAGRQILGRRLGHDQVSLALASMAEILLLLLVAALLAAPLAVSFLALSPTVVWSVAALGAAAALLVGCLPDGAPGLARWRAWTGRIAPRRLLHAASLHAVFFAVSGLLLWQLARIAGAPGGDGAGLAAGISALALAWIAGFVTPGSSAGFGIREAVLIATLQDSIGTQGSLVAALALRLVTTAGDLLFFAASLVVPMPPASLSTGPATVDRQV